MIPRGRPDIGWIDLCAALAGCAVPGNRLALEARAISAFGADGGCLACLSVRTGWDLVCRVMAWPRGSEVVVSAINLDDMLHIARHHGLVPIPVDVDPATLAVDPNELERAISEKTRAILVAHLFGSRMPLDDLVAVASKHNLLLVEDCAQAFSGDGFQGHRASDVRLFSFGPIKTRTALGGALVRFRDPDLHHRAAGLHQAYPVQSLLPFLRRLALFALLKGLSTRPSFSLFTRACAGLGMDYDRAIQQALRGFGGGDLIARIRRRPAPPLLRLLARRLEQSGPDDALGRIEYARRLGACLPEAVLVGAGCRDHTHWVTPIRCRDPERLIERLRAAGFDATRAASRLCAVSSGPKDSPPPAAAALLERLVYLPMWPEMSEHEMRRMADVVAAHEREQVPEASIT